MSVICSNADVGRSGVAPLIVACMSTGTGTSDFSDWLPPVLCRSMGLPRPLQDAICPPVCHSGFIHNADGGCFFRTVPMLTCELGFSRI
jgi:hypothetical protein